MLPCLFFRNSIKELSYVAVHVDNELVAGRNQVAIDSFPEEIRSEFIVTVRSLENFLRMQISLQEIGAIWMDQQKYIKRLLV